MTENEETSEQTTEQAPPPAVDWSKEFEGQTPEQIKQALTESRKWETRSKENFTKAQQLDALLKVLNPEADNPDPTKVANDLTAAQREAAATKVENAVLRVALKNNADAVRLTDSRSFMSRVGALDPSASDFEAKVKQAITKAVEDDPTLSKNPGPRPNPYQGQGSGRATTSRSEEGRAEAARRFGTPKQ